MRKEKDQRTSKHDNAHQQTQSQPHAHHDVRSRHSPPRESQQIAQRDIVRIVRRVTQGLDSAVLDEDVLGRRGLAVYKRRAMDPRDDSPARVICVADVVVAPFLRGRCHQREDEGDEEEDVRDEGDDAGGVATAVAATSTLLLLVLVHHFGLGGGVCYYGSGHGAWRWGSRWSCECGLRRGMRSIKLDVDWERKSYEALTLAMSLHGQSRGEMEKLEDLMSKQELAP